jgi:hypothetical protein
MKYSVVGDGSTININQGGDPRTPGVHLSGVIRWIAIQMGVLTPDDRDCTDDRNEIGQAVQRFPLEARLKMAVGLAWEDWLSSQYPDVMYHPGEMELDGILMTPDGLHPNETLYEFKVTWKSAFKLFNEGYDHKSFWMWRAQNMGYLKALGWRKVRQCILYVNGDYRGSLPQFVELDVEYTQEEIDDNWRLMLKHKHQAEKEG